VLLRSLGLDARVHLDLFEGELQPGDRLVLCSDGLTRHVSDEEILKVATRTRPERAVKQLVDMANVRGGRDNISVILLHAGEAVPRVPLPEREGQRRPLAEPALDDLHDTVRRRQAAPPAQPRRWWRWLLLVGFLGLLLAADYLFLRFIGYRALQEAWQRLQGLPRPVLPNWVWPALRGGQAVLILVLVSVIVMVWFLWRRRRRE
jgi:protein phosphatase